jgi:hypothetical protein
MNNFKFLNNLTGWIVFLIASATYCLTIEPTASFWDCGEFIATAYKLQIGHPPGAPFFMIIGRLATLFAFGDVTKVAMMMNLLSAFASAFTILFLFWSITHLARKMVNVSKEELKGGQLIGVLGAGVVGALAYTFSDTFWFSAVEGEVYATSSLFTALVFWAMLKWEDVADEPQADRWIVLIAYLMGISIGVHLLNLLAIPALAFIYYFRKNQGPVKRSGIIKTALVGAFLLGFMQFAFIPGVVSIAAKFELLFTNSFGLPFGTGAAVYIVLLIVALVWGVQYTIKKSKPMWNTVLLCTIVMLIGYASYGMIIIRSSADTPMDENNPENVFTLLSYLNREQYGTRPLAYGQYYNAPYDKQNPYKDGHVTYAPDYKTKKYIVVADEKANATPNYDPKYSTIFPRMWSNQPQHVRGYKKWAEIKGPAERVPTFGENLKFFATYQLGFMYFRYFMWNFAGRQNDAQGQGEISNGNWKSGINAIDDRRIGTQGNLPPSLDNKANNKFYFIPLILGLIGMIFQFERQKRDGLVMFLFFFFTGIAIILFLNQYTNEPRERDYGFAGSFYAFAFWIGFAVLAIQKWLSKVTPSAIAASISVALCLSAPILMAKGGWDDHDRSKRYTARDYASNYLNSCAPNAILFTNGDNDTFPLWYAQEVEGVRTDVRVVNLSLLNTDWYIDQVRRKAYDSDAVPINMEYEQYRQGVRDQVVLYDKGLNGYQNLKEMMDFVKEDGDFNKLPLQNGSKIEFFPSKKFSLPVDSATVVNNGTVPKELASQVVKSIDWEIDKNYLLKAELMILEILNSNNWKRPVYFAITVGDDSYLGLQDYFQLEGLAYKIVPVKNPPSPTGDFGRVESNIMYNNLMNKFKWGGVDKNELYMDENNLRMTMNFRSNFDRLAEKLIQEGKRDSVIKVVDKCFEVLPEKNVPYNYFVVPLSERYYQAGANTKADAVLVRYAQVLDAELKYYFSQKPAITKKFDMSLQRNMAILKRVGDIMQRYNSVKAKEVRDLFNSQQTQYMLLNGVSGGMEETE